MLGDLAAIASSTSCSSSSNVFKMIAEDFKQFCASSLMKFNIMSLRSLVLINVGKSLSLMLLIPGTPGTGVSIVPSLMKFSSEDTSKYEYFVTNYGFLLYIKIDLS